MRSLVFIVAGIILFALIVVISRYASGGSATLRQALMVFIPAWFLAAAINLTIGVTKAGYTVMEEVPIFLIIFGIPAVVALLAARLMKA